MTPMFSIIVPVYNVWNYIEVTIKSILAQTFSDFELLAVDDGSTDGSGEYLDMIAATDKRVRVFHQPNSGVSAARNLGLDNARGEWIVFVDGDDALIPQALDILAGCIARNPDVDLIGYRFNKVDCISNSSLTAYKDNNRIETDSIHEIIFECKHQACFQALDHYMVWTETFRRDKLGEIRFEPLKNGEDVLYCNALGLQSDMYIAIKSPLYLYLQRPASAKSNKWTSLRHSDYIALHNGILDNIIKSPKKIDSFWYKRWIGNLLQYVPEAFNFEKSFRKECFRTHRTLLKEVKRIADIPTVLKTWISIATLFKSDTYFRLTAMTPMKWYSSSRAK